MQLLKALGISTRAVVVLVGGGGKTTLMFRLADELVASGRHVVTSMTTKIFVAQMRRAPMVLLLEGEGELSALPGILATYKHVLVAGRTVVEQDKVEGVPAEVIDHIAALPGVDAVLVEADGSRRLPFKAPAAHEPVIPAAATQVVPLVGLDVLGQPLDGEHVHRPQLVAALTGGVLGAAVTPAMVAAVLAHPQGGGKGVPVGAQLVPFLNKADDAALLAAARQIAGLLLADPLVDRIVIGAARSDQPVREVWVRVGAVILAAGEAKRYGTLKQIAPWRGLPLVAHVARQALACSDLARVVVTTGAQASAVKEALLQVRAEAGRPAGDRSDAGVWSIESWRRRLSVIDVPDWRVGQSRSVRAGLRDLIASPAQVLGDLPVSYHGLDAPGEPQEESNQSREVDLRTSSLPQTQANRPFRRISAAIFLQADQPGVTPELLAALVQRHRETLAPVVAPRYRGQRGTPVLFDQVTFPEFDHLAGDVGARPIIQAHAHEIAWVDWPTPEILYDIDTPEDYRAISADV